MRKWEITSYEGFFSEILHIEKEHLDELIKNKESKNLYLSYYEKSKKHGSRKIYIINNKSEFYDLQENLMKNFLGNILISDSAYGFVRGKNYLDFLEPHLAFNKDKNYLRLDIKDFFGSITKELLEEVLDYYFKEEKIDSSQKTEIIKYIIEIITYENKIIQGALTSPIISNIIFRQLDIRIERYCSKLDIEYSRYADDLLFSSENNKVHSKDFVERIQEIINSKNFKINYSKTIRAKKDLSINGYVLNKSIRLSRKKLDNISTLLFILENMKFKNIESDIKTINRKIKELSNKKSITFNNEYSLLNKINGIRSFIISVLKYSNDEKFIKKAEKLINRIEKIILKISKKEMS